MNRKTVAGILMVPVAAVLAVFALIMMSIAGAGMGSGAAAVAALGSQEAALASNECQTSTTPIDISGIKVTQWLAAQKANAAAIVEQVKAESAIAAKDKMRAAVIALMTAMQESSLTNINYGDKAGPDSRGLFQQRAAWGPLADRMNPHKAAHMFLTGGQGGQNGLVDFDGKKNRGPWQGMPLTYAAQAVQVSAFPTAYAKWEGPATLLAVALMGAPSSGAPVPDPCGAGPGGTPPKAAADVEAMLGYAKSLLGTPYRLGGTTYPPGVDCSGLLVYSWGKAGHPLAVRTSEQMWRVSTELQPGQEQRGDLVFSEFHGGGVANGPGPGHIMIVWDPKAGTVIEAPHTGDVVKYLKYKTLPGIKFGRFKASAWVGQ